MITLERNEVSIELAGESRIMRATFSAIRSIERDIGKSLVKIIEDLGFKGDLSITNTALIVFHGLRGFGDPRMSLDQVGDAIVDEGVGEKAVAAVNFLRIALTGTKTEGKPETPAA